MIGGASENAPKGPAVHARHVATLAGLATGAGKDFTLRQTNDFGKRSRQLL